MKKRLLLLFILLCSTTLIAQTASQIRQQFSENITSPAYERILYFHSDIVIQEDREVVIKETIVVNALNLSISRGIYRELPLRYKQSNGGSYNVLFDLIDVKRNGVEEEHHTESFANGVRIYAGSPDVIVDLGVHVYEITYSVNYVVQFFDEFDELYWNVNGNGWGFMIDSISATLHYPGDAKLYQNDWLAARG